MDTVANMRISSTAARRDGMMCAVPDVAGTEPVRPGVAATEWLLATAKALQAEDPLRPVTLVVPAHQAGLALRRRMATEGYANVRFTILARLAESLGASRLSGEERTPLTAVTRAALLRGALQAAGGPLAGSSEHAGLVDLVAALARDLRRTADPAAAIERIKSTGTPTSRAAVATVAEYERRRAAAGLYDDVDLLDAAAQAVTAGAAGSALADMGAVIAYQPARIDAPEAAFLSALTQLAAVTIAETEPGADPVASLVTIAPDPVEEVRAAVRDLLAAAEGQRSVPLHRNAIVYRDADTYGPLLRDTLNEAGIPYTSLDGAPLGESIAARGLLGLIRLRDRDFTRAAVLGWLSGLPHTGGVLRNQARWDQLSRDAGVVRGVDQWRDRLTAFSDRKRERLGGLDREVEDATVEAHAAALERDIEDSQRIVEYVLAMDTATRTPQPQGWSGYVDWALRLRDEFLRSASSSPEEQEADQQLEETLRSLTEAAVIEPTVELHVFLRTLEDALAARRRPEGRAGRGVVIGPHRLLLGMDFDRVHILGAVEGSFAAALPVDPLLPGDPLNRRAEQERQERRDWLVALRVAPEATVSAPVVDIDGRTLYPSPWLLELLIDGDEPVSASAVRRSIATHPRLRYIRTAEHAVASATPLSLAERREAEAERYAGSNLVASALAKRDDLPLGRALRAARARRSSDLTDFDGNVAAVANLPLIARGLSETAQSATGVETWAVCPFRFLLGRVLTVSATQEPEDERWWRIDPGEKGTLIHGILQRFYGDVIAGGPGPSTHEGLRRIDELAAGAFADAEHRGVVGHPLAWENERAAILADLRTLLTKDVDDMRAASWTPSAVEQPFGYPDNPHSWPVVEVTLPDGSAVRLRGYIDRIDSRPGAHRITDYKTGKTKASDIDAAHRFDAGRKLQLPVYGTALRQHLVGRGEDADAVESRYWYISSGGGFSVVPLAVTTKEEGLLRDVLQDIDSGVRAGCFPQIPGEYQEHFADYKNCGFCDYGSLCPANRDVIAEGKEASPARLPFNALQPGGSDDAQ
jgi:ATP-dependent helicase/nuclease subunit B